MKPRLIILIGSPGSGKTSYINQLISDGFTSFDDYLAEAKGNYGIMNNSKHKHDLMKAVSNQENCVIADTKFSQLTSQNDLKQFIMENKLDDIATIEWEAFENDEFACMANVINRNKGDIRKTIEQIKLIINLSKGYMIPKNTKKMRSWIWPKENIFKIKNDRDEFSIKVTATKIWENKEEYNDIRIKYSIEITNSNKDWGLHISDVTTYINWCENDKLVEMENIIEKLLKKEIERVINFDNPGEYVINSASFDFRNKI